MKSSIEDTVIDIKNKYLLHPLRGEPQTKRSIWGAFYSGEQNVIREQSEKSTDTTKRKKARYRSQINIIKPNAKISVAKLLKDDPIAICVPTGQSENDILAARTATKLMEYFHERSDLDLVGKTYQALEAAYIYGTGYKVIGWNADKRFFDSKTRSWRQVGDVDVEVADDFEIYPDPTQRDYFKIQWYIRSYLQNIPIIEKTYPELKDKIQPFKHDPNEDARLYIGMDTYNTEHESIKNKALVLEYLERPTEEFPQGRRVVTINYTTLAYYGVNPYHVLGYDYSLNIVPYWWNKSYRQFHGQSAVREQIPIQIELNKFCTIMVENAKNTAAIKIAVPRGSGLHNGTISDRPGEIMETVDGKATMLSPAALPHYLTEYRNWLIGINRDITGIQEVSMGAMPSSTHISGAALKQLMDAEMVRMAPEMRNLKMSMQIEAMILLGLYRHFVKEQRYVTILGENKDREIMAFQDSSLAGNWDIQVFIGSAFNNSPSAKIEALLNLWDRGVIQEGLGGNPAAIKMLRMLEFGDMSDAKQTSDLHRTRAEWVAEMILENGEVPDILPFDDHPTHIEVLSRYVLNPAFEDQDQDVRDAMIGRIMQHMRFMQPQQAPDAAGGPPPPGGMPPGPPMGGMEAAAAMEQSPGQPPAPPMGA